jgi:hypothetical protein
MTTTKLLDHRRFVQAVRVWAALNGFLLIALGLPIVLMPCGLAAFTAVQRDLSAIPGISASALVALVWWKALSAVRKGLATIRVPDLNSDRHWLVATKALRWLVGRSLIMLAVGLVLTWLAIIWNGPRSEAFAGAAAAWDSLFVFIMMGDVFGGASLLQDVAVVPYFTRCVGGIDTFVRGKSLARRLNEVDEQARALGLIPLSDFGWNDDLSGEPLVWREPADCLTTVDALLMHYRDDQATESGLIDDLMSLAYALESARAQTILFCLLLRHGDVTSGHEWDCRQGTCF